MFVDGAVDRIAAYSGGIPRLINTVCDHCLLFGYADNKRRIDRTIVNQAIEYLEDGVRSPGKVRGAASAKARLLVRWSVGTLMVTIGSAIAALALKANSAALVIQSVRQLLLP